MKSLFLFSASAAAFVGFSAGQAGAQQAVNPIDHCRETSATDEARIACLEAAITALMSVGRPVAAADAPEQEKAEAADEAAETARVAETGAEEARLAAAEAEEEPVATGLGSEQVIARQERETKEGREKRKKRAKAEPFEARLVDFAHTKTGRLILVLDNGQVWAQRSGDRTVVRLDDGDTPEVKVRRGALSGYRMELSHPNITIVVERLK